MDIKQILKVSEIKKLPKWSKGLLNESLNYYRAQLKGYSKICELENEVAKLSNCAVARALDDTLKEIAQMSSTSYFETLPKYLNQAIEDLASGMDAVDMLWKYDNILYEMRNPKSEHRGYRVGNLIIDDLCDIDKDILNDALKE